MFKKVFCLLYFATLFSSLEAYAALKILPLGDSITHGYTSRGGYRYPLEKLMKARGVSIDFVGSEKSKKDSFFDATDVDHEGHLGWRIDQISAKVPEWIRNHNPDIVLLLIGTNDVYQKFDVTGAPQRLRNLVRQILTIDPQVRVIVGSLFPAKHSMIQDPNVNRQIEQDLDYFNREIKSQFTEISPRFRLVDLNDRMNAMTMTVDGVHPTKSAYEEIARRWFSALIRLLD